MLGRRRRLSPTGAVWRRCLRLSLIGAVRYEFASATMPPYPLSVGYHTQPDGSVTGDLYLRGTPEDHNVRVEDSDGFTILRDASSGYYTYAIRDPTTGGLVSSRCVVGRCDPVKEGLAPHEQPDDRTRRRLADETGFGRQKQQQEEQRPRPRSLIASGEPEVLKNLVLLLRFSDHMDRDIPSREDYEVLFNTIGANPDDHPQCPTGSVRDYFLINSYGKLDVQSEIFEWVDLPNSEAYYADGKFGVSGKLQREGIAYGLTEVEKRLIAMGRSFSDFDTDENKLIDSITVIHSGYDASMAETECGTTTQKESRIWSHKWTIPGYWTSQDHVRVGDYNLNAGLWGNCGNEISRVGVIVHEISHFLGLPDLYDGTGGNGLGSWDLMGNVWGFDASQRYPPSLMPYHKAQLNWLDPVEIVEEGNYTLPPSHQSGLVYIIQLGKDGEYLMLENRQRYSFEAQVPEGLLILHIDTAASTFSEGYPEMEGWPENGQHYKHAVLAADGRYQLERGKSYGDKGDVYRHDSVNGIGPHGTISVDGTLKAPYPRTMSYQGGIIQTTGHYILNVSAPDANNSISFVFKTCLDCGFNGEKTTSPSPPSIVGA